MKYLILGGGITGLSAAWHLKKKDPDAQITLLEKENRLGGWIQTSREGGFLFEKGPRTFQLGRSPHLLKLINELNLQIISSPPLKRYLYYKGKLRSLSSLLPILVPYLLREPFIAPSTLADESIYDFAARRFSPKIAEMFFDPLTLGIYGGDIRELSMRACFPALFDLERTKGSLVRAFFSSPKTPKGLFTLAGGMETLIHTLEKKLSIDIVLNCEVESISSAEVVANGKVWRADRVISALPPSFPSKSLWVVNLVFPSEVISKRGFGYLVPTKEKESLLGVVFDSTIFPQQNRQNETRLTAMLQPEEPEPISTALKALRRHLNITAEPLYASTFFAKNAIPQFPVGCGYTDGISVDACIHRGSKISQLVGLEFSS